MNDRKLILDVDTGIDDALALAYLATFPNVELLGVIGTYGNVAVDTAVRNTVHVLEQLGLQHVPVLHGASHPSWADCFVPDAGCAQFHGPDGLGGFGPNPSRGERVDHALQPSFQPVSAETTAFDSARIVSVGGYALDDPHANPATHGILSPMRETASASSPAMDENTPLSDGAQFIIERIRQYGTDVTVVATGPLTNVDTALREAPDIAKKLKLVLMGGTLTQEGNCWDLTAETNIIQDPEAADRVFHSGADITMVGLDVTHQCLMGKAVTAGWRGSQLGDFLANLADFSIAANLKSDARLFSGGMPLHDPLAAAVALDETLVSCFDLPMKVETKSGDLHGTRGRTVGDPEGLINSEAPRVHVALQVDHSRFVDDFATRLTNLVRR
jgi:purine nucleosidase